MQSLEIMDMLLDEDVNLLKGKKVYDLICYAHIWDSLNGIG